MRARCLQIASRALSAQYFVHIQRRIFSINHYHGQSQSPRKTYTRGGETRELIVDDDFEENFFHQEGPDATSDVKAEIPRTEAVSIVERRLIAKARLNGIESKEKLEFEADIGHTRDIGSRLTDGSRRQDLDLWLLLLEYNTHHHGVRGAKAIWRATVFRGSPVELDVRNRNASDLIRNIIISTVEDIPFLKEFCLSCIHRGIFVDQLFVLVIGTLLLLAPTAAASFTILLKDPCFRDKNDLLELLRIACQSEHQDAVTCFCKVRSCLPDFKTYGAVIPEAWAAGKPSAAFTLHKYLLSRGDLPQYFDQLKPFVEHIAASEDDIQAFLYDLSVAEASFEHQVKRYYGTQLVNQAKRMSVGQQSSRDPRGPSDDTSARILASFPFDFAIQSLVFFGLAEVGPMSIRQIVRNSPGSPTLKERFARLQELEIDTGSSVYVRLLKRLSVNGVFKIVKELAASDMHHDEYENRDLQRRLLKNYVLNQDHTAVNRTLTILHEGRLGREVETSSSNLLLRTDIATCNWPEVLNRIDRMCQQDQDLEQYSLSMLVQALLEPPRPGHKSMDQVGFLIALLQRLMAAEQAIQPATWLRPLTALAMQGRLDEFEYVAIWLADWYTTAFEKGQDSFDRDLSKLFPKRLQEAMIAWGFTKINWGAAGTISRVPWLWGGKLLKTLHTNHGVKIDVLVLREVFVLRLRMLFLASASGKAPSNSRHAVAMGRMHPKRYVESWLDLWGDLEFMSEKEQEDMIRQVTRDAWRRKLSVTRKIS